MGEQSGKTWCMKTGLKAHVLMVVDIFYGHRHIEMDIRKMSDDEDLSWTTGNDPDLSHVRSIDAGASGDVHEVSPFLKYTN
jgi:hypothetical protein